MDSSGMEALYRLQQVELDLAELAKKTQDSEEVAAVAHARERASHCQRLLEKAERGLESARVRLKRLERELSGLEESLMSVEARLYGGEVTHPKELAALQERLDSDRTRKAACEEEVLAAMDVVEQAERALEKVRTAETSAQKALRKAVARLNEAKAGWTAQMRRLEETRSELRRAAQADLLSLYDSLKERFAGRPLARVNERSCGGCHVEMPTAMRKPAEGQIQRCPHCGRLLWWP